MSALYNTYYGATEEQKKSEAFTKQISEQEKAINLESDALKKSFIKAHPQSLASLDLVKSIAGPVVETSIIKPLFESLAANVKESVAGKKYAAYLEKLAAVEIGAEAPAINQPDTAGKMVSLASYRGKYVLIDFWASWCKPCRAENPNLRRDYERFHPKGFEVLGVSLDQANAKAAWIKAIHDDQLSWAQVSDLKYWKSEVAEAYSVRAIPQSFLIDPNGKIVAKNLRGDELTQKLEELFGK